MKKLKRILSGVAAVALAASSFMGLTTAQAAGTGSITINLPDVQEVQTQKSRVATLAAALPSPAPTDFTFDVYQVLVPATEGEKNYITAEGWADFFTTNSWPTEVTGKDVYITYESGALKFTAYASSDADGIATLGDYIKVTGTTTVESGSGFAASLLEQIVVGSNAVQQKNNVLLTKWMKTYADANSIDPVLENQKPNYNGGKYTITFDELDAGYYLITANNIPAGFANVEMLLYLEENENLEVDVKAEYNEVKKQVKKASANDDTLTDALAANIDETLEYVVNLEVPNLTNYNLEDVVYKYLFSDTLTNQELVPYTDGHYFEVKYNNITYKDGGSPDLAGLLEAFTTGNDGELKDLFNATDYDDTLKAKLIKDDASNTGIAITDYDYNDDNTQKIALNFKVAKLRELLATGGAMEIRYQAKLTADAVKSNDNTANLDYTRDPYGDTDSRSDDTKVYTYGIDVLKTWSDGDGDMSKVSFTLTKKGTTDSSVAFHEKITCALTEHTHSATCGEADEWNDCPNNGQEHAHGFACSSGAYTVAASGTTTVHPNASGHLDLYGLEPGTYVLHENAIDGYVGMGDVTIVIAADGTTTWSMSNSTAKVGAGENIGTVDEATGNKGYIKFNYTNTATDYNPGTTGGMGVWLFGIGGILMLAGAAFVYSSLRKKNIA